jgi:hypothetical protein
VPRGRRWIVARFAATCINLKHGAPRALHAASGTPKGPRDARALGGAPTVEEVRQRSTA